MTADLNQRAYSAISVAALTILLATYWRPFRDMYTNWNLVDSYYSHGYLIAPISAYLVWTKRKEIRDARIAPSPLGYPLLIGGGILLLLGDFLGFGVFQQLSLLPVLAGLTLLFLGKQHFKLVWFPLAFLVMMIPIPPSLTQSIALNLKMVAAEAAVVLARAMTLPMIREGSFIYFKDDFLLIGEVCGGLRSLIALFAIGTLAAYFSNSSPIGRLLVIGMSAPIAVAANIFRILFLCVAGYFWGSDAVEGRVHDISGILIFAVAFVLFFMLEALLKRVLPQKPDRETAAS